MSDRTRTPPETPTALAAMVCGCRPGVHADHQNAAVEVGLIKQSDKMCSRGWPLYMRDVITVSTADQARAVAGRGSWLGENAAALISQQQATPHEAHYHTFEFRDSTAKLAKHPPDWFDGSPKPCPGSGLAPGVQFHGEVSDDGEPKYLCRCPWCDKPQRPGPMPEHTFVPVRAEELAFTTGKVMYGIEPTGVAYGFDPGPGGHDRAHPV